MQTVVLDFARVATKSDLHGLLKEAFAFPEYYGENLDALYDCLTDLHGETEIELKHLRSMTDALGGYGRSFLRVLFDAERDSEGDLKVIL